MHSAEVFVRWSMAHVEVKLAQVTLTLFCIQGEPELCWVLSREAWAPLSTNRKYTVRGKKGVMHTRVKNAQGSEMKAQPG